jgi:hypothetical protein
MELAVAMGEESITANKKIVAMAAMRVRDCISGAREKKFADPFFISIPLYYWWPMTAASASSCSKFMDASP